MSDILITGGTGSFGQAFVKSLIGSNYERIVVYSRDEHKQERMKSELNSDQVRYFIGDVRDKDRLRLATRGCWDIVHAAALKIVPSGEYNPMEYIKTNILGSQNIIDICLENEHMGSPRKVIFISTDKAVNPVNLYGATKLCMEKLALASNNLTTQYGATRALFGVCRYGNVANSNGSVIKVFEKQYKLNLPFTITDPNMTRFWIELEEAVEFVKNSLNNMYNRFMSDEGKGGLFIPDMPSFKIMDLAKAFRPNLTKHDINYLGIREGEKLHEQLDEKRFSNTNDKWLSSADIKTKLNKFGVL